MVKAAGWPMTSFPPVSSRTTHQEGAAMVRPTWRARIALKVERSCERSRLEEQVLATTYELITPILRRPIPNSGRAGEPVLAGSPGAYHRSRKTGGSQA